MFRPTQGQDSGGYNTFGRGSGGGGGRGRSSYRGGGGGSGRGFQGQRGGRGRGDGQNIPGQVSEGEEPSIKTCQFFVRGDNCRYGDNCRNSHAISRLMCLNAHEQPIKSINFLNAGDPSSFTLLSGSKDTTIKAWSPIGPELQAPMHVISTKGSVESIEVSGSTILYANDEVLEGYSTDVPVGIIYLMVPGSSNTTPILRSEEFPYTHSGKIRNFKIVQHEGGTYVISSGADNMIRTWRYDVSSNKFELLVTMEGHLRAVSCLLLHETQLWTGSLDHTIRVWDLSSGRCLGILKGPTTTTPSAQGHTDAITCFELIPPLDSTGQAYIASGGADGNLILWKVTGEFEYGCSHNASIMTMTLFQDNKGGIPVLLLGMIDGRIIIRSTLTMELLIVIDGSLLQYKPIYSLVNIGQSCFACGGESGTLIVYHVMNPILSPKS